MPSNVQFSGLKPLFVPQQRKRQRVEQGVVFIDDEQENDPTGGPSGTTEPNTAADGLPSSCCVSTLS